MSIQNALNTALYGTLSGNSTLTDMLTSAGTSIFFLQMPDQLAEAGLETDYVVFSYQGGGDENIIPVRMKDDTLNIRAISKVGPAKAGSIDAQVDALLHLQPLTVAGWCNFWLAREGDFSLIETDAAGEKWWTTGGLYRIRLNKE